MSAELVRKAVRDHRGATLGWTAALVLTLALQLSIYPAVRDAAADLQRVLENYPPALRSMFQMGSDFGTGIGYLRTEMFGVVVPVLLIGLAIGQGASAIAAEEQHGTLDLLLANPIPRRRLVLARAGAIALDVLAAAAVLAVVLLAGSWLAGLSAPVGRVLAAVAATGLLAALFGALALAVGAATGRRGVALGTAVAAALVSFLLDSLGGMAGWLADWRVLSPFHLASPAEALQGDLGLGGVVVVVALTVLFGGVAAAAFERRDIRCGGAT